MNQPIGIPSGWEEIVAEFIRYGSHFLKHGNWQCAKTSAESYIKVEHDWREEP